MTAIGQQLEQAKRNFEVGTATITDTHEAQARYDLTVSQEIAARNDLEIRKRQLELIIGRPAPGVAPLGPRFSLRAARAQRAWTAGSTTRATTTCRCASAAPAWSSPPRRSSATAPGIARRSMLSPPIPTRAPAPASGAAFGHRHQQQGGRPAARDSRSTRAGSSARACARRSPTRTKRARTWRARGAPRELTARQTFLGVTSGHRAGQGAGSGAGLQPELARLHAARPGSRACAPQVDVLNAQQQLSQTRRDLAQAKYNYILALLRLKSAAGPALRAGPRAGQCLARPIRKIVGRTQFSTQSRLAEIVCVPILSLKADLRKQVLARRDALPASERRALSARITKRLLALDAYRSARCVMAYSSFGSEFETGGFIVDVLAQGKTLVLPRVERGSTGAPAPPGRGPRAAARSRRMGNTATECRFVPARPGVAARFRAGAGRCLHPALRAAGLRRRLLRRLHPRILAPACARRRCLRAAGCSRAALDRARSGQSTSSSPRTRSTESPLPQTGGEG